MLSRMNFSSVINISDEDSDLVGVSSDGPTQLHKDVLKAHFGHDKFRPMQWRIIAAILNRQDNFAVMATGYGKSLCFQYPPVFMDGVGLVISPLISLMEDQVLSLNVSNIPACFLGSAQTDKQVLRDVFKKKYRLVYLTPEYITGELGDRLLHELRDDLTLIAIDEAHCVSQWGHDFRTAYRQLDSLRNKTLGVPIVAVTATATESVRTDIIRCLRLQDPLISCSGFDRPNLEFRVHLKSESGPMTDLRPQIRGTPRGSIIIYCLTRKQTEEIARLLQSNGMKCEPYHAGLSVTQRRSVHEKFVRDRVQIIAATIAFGMGIDKPDVRLVIHYGASKDIESYYQEVGRAGRDGQPARCIMFYNRGDFATHTHLRESGNMSAAVKKNLEKLSDKMWDYLNTRECRRLSILKYFEGNKAKCSQRKNCCDNCDRNMSSTRDCDKYEGLDNDGKYDFTQDAKKLLGAMTLFNGKKGVNASVLTLRGSKAKTVPDFAQSHALFGSGKDKAEDWWKSLAILLDREGLTQKQSISFGGRSKFKRAMQCVSVSSKGQNWMKYPTPLKLIPTTEMFPLLPKKKSLSQSQASSSATTSDTFSTSATTSNDALKSELMQLLLQKRTEIASKFDIMPYMVASNAAIIKLAALRPLNLDELQKARPDGFNAVKIAKFGPSFLQVIQEKLNYLPQSKAVLLEKRSMEELMQENPLPNAKMTPAITDAYEKFMAGSTAVEIGQGKNIQTSTVFGYLSTAILCGMPVKRNDIARLGVDEIIFTCILSALPKSYEQGVPLKELKNLLPQISMEAIRVVSAYYHVRWHLDNLKLPYIDPDNAKNESKGFLDDDDDDLLLLADAKIIDEKPKKDFFADDDDDFIDDDFLANLEKIEKDVSETLYKSQDSAYFTNEVGKRPSTDEILSQFEVKKAKIQNSPQTMTVKKKTGGLDIVYGVDSSEDEEPPPSTKIMNTPDGWTSNISQTSLPELRTSPQTKKPFVFKTRKIF